MRVECVKRTFEKERGNIVGGGGNLYLKNIMPKPLDKAT